MQKDRGFNFKLLLPSRGRSGQVSAVRPLEMVESCGDFMNSLQQGHSKGFEKEQSGPFPNTSVIEPTRPELPRMKAVSPMEKGENNCTPGQLYSKLFDEVEKIKCWKVKADSDSVQKERKLQENKRTIETQRKAIQDLQFGSESLSVKLEEQISENEDLRNRNDSTRILCNILKDTFQRSAENMHLFESEREETHHLFMENTGSIKKMIASFESLRIQAEADQQELQKVREALLQFEDLKEQYHQEYNMKEKEVAVLQTRIKDKENELQQLLLHLDENQKQCKHLQEATNEQYELLKSSKQEQESILQRLNAAEQHCKETEETCEAIAATLAQSKEEYGETIQNKDLSLQELTRVKTQQAEKLEEIQTTIQKLQNSLALEILRTKELEDNLMANNKELERRNTLLGESREQRAEKDEQIKILADELDKTSKSIESMKGKIEITELRVEELAVELSRKTEEVHLFKNEAEIEKAEQDRLKKTCEAAENAQEDLKEKATVTEMKVQDLEEQLNTEITKNTEQTCQMEQLRKDFTQQKVKYKKLVSTFNELQCEKTAIQLQLESGSSDVKTIEANMKVSEENVGKLTREIQRLEAEKQCLREEVISIKSKSHEAYQESETLQKKIEENCEHLQEEIAEKEHWIKSVETKLCNLRKKFDIKLKAQEECQKENKMLKKQIAKENEKSSQLEIVINGLQEESQNLKRLNQVDHQKLLQDLESKSSFATELENKLQKLRLTAVEAINNKEDTEVMCQQKITDMLAIMEQHKSQYDQMVHEKDAELDAHKRKETEAAALMKSLVGDLTKNRAENDQLTKQLKTEITQKEHMQKELTDLKKVLSSTKCTQPSEARRKQSPDYKQRCSKTPKDSSSTGHTFDFSEAKKTPSHSQTAFKKKPVKQTDTESIRTSCGTTPKTKEIHNEDLKTPKSSASGVGGTSKIKSYRIRTPPSAEKAALWGKVRIEIDPKSDSSDLSDLLTFASAPAPNFSAPQSKHNILKKVQSPFTHKSPGNSLKLTAMKRMRDAGWTAVAGCDKKKRTTNEKIFA
ncbi:synaptonemal complex protein 1 [Pseudoliparis swirei]|uniref:synaptonemal complex protein 1 n=1 Tax=Pseudoliparis swirei TaxID=2059687 RepID=UPI0024BE38C3|nr:synaptonemal complex protein 1 [Pseudoliparis swirei]